MMIISFAWTTDAFKAGRKNVTRRTWTPAYAKKIKPRQICKAYDKQPRFGGKQIGIIKILSKTWEDILTMLDEDYENEGFKYMEEQGKKIWNKHPRQAFEEWREAGGWYWVVRFDILLIGLKIANFG